MSKTDIFNGQYIYLAYPIGPDVENSEILFQFGLPLKSKLLETYKTTIAYDEGKFQEWLTKYPFQPFKSKRLCIVKIPLCYMGSNKTKAEYAPCMPLIRTYFDYVNGARNYLIPNLVLGIYNSETNEYEENPNYDTKYDPKGLQFANEQIDKMKIWLIPGIVEHALYRRNISYEVLKQQDELSGDFNTTIEYYSNITKTAEKKQKDVKTLSRDKNK